VLARAVNARREQKDVLYENSAEVFREGKSHSSTTSTES
jgi:cob(I)alamin adenosyltransferase